MDLDGSNVVELPNDEKVRWDYIWGIVNDRLYVLISNAEWESTGRVNIDGSEYMTFDESNLK